MFDRGNRLIFSPAGGVHQGVTFMADQPTRGSERSERQKSIAVLVDGYAKDLFAAGMMLQRMDHDVYIVSSAEEALRIIDAALPALVVTELTLPQMSGLELLIRIKHDPRTKAVPVIVHTSSDDEKKKELCRVSGCSAYLRKWVDPGVLYSVIQEATAPIPRQFIRLRTLLPVMVGGQAASGNAAGTEYVTELSEAGIFVRTLHPRPVNAVLPVTIIIRTMPIKLKAMVVHSEPLVPGLAGEPGMGMKFVEISTTDREVVRNVIKGQILKDITGP
jgi:CheY-like chemotaxis protein